MDKNRDTKDRVAIPLDPEEALRALLQVDPNSEPVKPAPEPQREPRDDKPKR